MKSKTGVLFARLMCNIMRSPDTIITVAITPIMILLLFNYVLGGAISGSIQMSGGIEVSYVNYQIPGILLMAVGSGIAYTAMRLFTDTKGGLMARFNTMPIKRSSILWAHVLTSLVSNMLTIVIIFLVALMMGFRSSASILDWLAVAGILVLYTLALTWIAVIPGLTAKSMEGATSFSYLLIFLPFVSSAFAPTETMPTAVRVFAENQPVTSIVNTIRSLLNGGTVGNDIWVALAWCVGIVLVASFFSGKAFRRQLG